MLVDENSLIETAMRVRLEAYAPYSGYKVGAALLCDDGSVFTGANVENASYGLSLCAERVAVAGAVAAGNRNFDMLVIVADSEMPCPPCGACRQVLSEFGPDTMVVMANLEGDTQRAKVKELLPYAFSSRQLFQGEHD
jgi:cytidine deaminase